jgi:hypothetical protein
MTYVPALTSFRQVRATYTDCTIRVYQAYSDSIADTALKKGTFVSPPFKMGRMTWIKPSFLWMMCRAGWGKREEQQKRILAIDITREGFEWALSNSRLTHQESKLDIRTETSLVLVQWDPERDIFCNPLQYRSIQIGIRGEAIVRYMNDWIVTISDMTSLAESIHDYIAANAIGSANARIPEERQYPLNLELKRH